MVKKVKKKGGGLLDVLRQGLSVAKTLSDATGIKPSSFLASKGPYGAIGSALLASQGLGSKKSKIKGSVGGMQKHKMEDRMMMKRGPRGCCGGAQYASGVNNTPNAASIGVIRF